METFKFEDEIQLREFSRILENIYTGRLYCTFFFSAEKLARLFVLKEVKTVSRSQNEYWENLVLVLAISIMFAHPQILSLSFDLL